MRPPYLHTSCSRSGRWIFANDYLPMVNIYLRVWAVTIQRILVDQKLYKSGQRSAERSQEKVTPNLSRLDRGYVCIFRTSFGTGGLRSICWYFGALLRNVALYIYFLCVYVFFIRKQWEAVVGAQRKNSGIQVASSSL